MAQNAPGPFIFEIPYIVQGMAHSLTLNCDTIGSPTPGSAPTDVTLRTKGGDGILLSGGANAFWNVVRTLFGTDMLASTYTLWRVTGNNTEREFISAGNLTTPNGGFGSSVLAQQKTFTWRSGGGGIAKLVLMEPNATGSTRIPTVSSPDGADLALNTWVLSADSFLMARERAFPVAAMNLSLGQNEKIFRRRYRL